jgi:hypothetical protein
MIEGGWEILAVLLAGVWAGAINTIVGSGTLITFPVLLAVGVPPVTANVSNSIGLVPGSATGAWGYRRELAGQAHRVRWLVPAITLGSLAGALLLLVLPSSAFNAIVPVLIGVGVVLVVLGPRIQKALARRRSSVSGDHGWVWPAMLATGVYGGYFGAAQGVLQMAILGIGVDDDVQRHNALKNVLSAVVNGVAGLVFIVVADVDWFVVLLIGGGAIVGGLLGARIGRWLPPNVLRAVIVTVGVTAIVALLVG